MHVNFTRREKNHSIRKLILQVSNDKNAEYISEQK